MDTALEPQARTEASGLRFWKPLERNALERDSYYFEIPVMQNTKLHSPRIEGWVPMRIRILAKKDGDDVLGDYWTYVVSVLLLQRGTLAPARVLKELRAREPLRTRAKAMQRAGEVGRSTFDHYRLTGLTMDALRRVSRDYLEPEEMTDDDEEGSDAE